MNYYRRYTDISMHPQAVRAGFWGERVFTALCDVNARFDLGGDLPAHYVAPDMLVRELNLFDQDCPSGGALQAVCNGLQRANVAGLIVQKEDGSITIPGWERRNPNVPLNSTQRSRNRRALQKMQRVQRGETLPLLPAVAATQERRGENRRGEERDAAAALSSTSNRDPGSGVTSRDVFDLWNAIPRPPAKVPLWRTLSTKDAAQADDLAKQFTRAEWVEAFDVVARSAYLNGYGKTEFLLNPNYLLKAGADYVHRILSGAFDSANDAQRYLPELAPPPAPTPLRQPRQEPVVVAQRSRCAYCLAPTQDRSAWCAQHHREILIAVSDHNAAVQKASRYSGVPDPGECIDFTNMTAEDVEWVERQLDLSRVPSHASVGGP